VHRGRAASLFRCRQPAFRAEAAIRGIIERHAAPSSAGDPPKQHHRLEAGSTLDVDLRARPPARARTGHRTAGADPLRNPPATSRHSRDSRGGRRPCAGRRVRGSPHGDQGSVPRRLGHATCERSIRPARAHVTTGPAESISSAVAQSHRRVLTEGPSRGGRNRSWNSVQSARKYGFQFDGNLSKAPLPPSHRPCCGS
jgi:hypothetical protein